MLNRQKNFDIVRLRRRRPSLKPKPTHGKPEAFRKESGGAAMPSSVYVCYLFVLKKQGVCGNRLRGDRSPRRRRENAEVAERNAEWE